LEFVNYISQFLEVIRDSDVQQYYKSQLTSTLMSFENGGTVRVLLQIPRMPSLLRETDVTQDCCDVQKPGRISRLFLQGGTILSATRLLPDLDNEE